MIIEYHAFYKCPICFTEGVVFLDPGAVRIVKKKRGVCEVDEEYHCVSCCSPIRHYHYIKEVKQ